MSDLEISPKSEEHMIGVVIANLSSLILLYGKRKAQEEQFPGRDPDTMDDIIAANERKVTLMRIIRKNVEDVYAGTIQIHQM